MWNILVGEYFPQIFLRTVADSGDLSGAQIGARIGSGGVESSGLYFNENEHKSVAGDDIEFALACSPVAADDREPFAAEHFCGIFFSGSAEPDMGGFSESERISGITVYFHFPGAVPERW